MTTTNHPENQQTQGRAADLGQSNKLQKDKGITSTIAVNSQKTVTVRGRRIGTFIVQVYNFDDEWHAEITEATTGADRAYKTYILDKWFAESEVNKARLIGLGSRSAAGQVGLEYVICDLISQYEDDRARARRNINDFLEIGWSLYEFGMNAIAEEKQKRDAVL